mmetsp:Transcript_19325/g.40751  ORF Transcript_19325/g.40751 Transcript_19325/m.40751 type:complete len:152 (-) Transcript_19325:137-592(-)
MVMRLEGRNPYTFASHSSSDSESQPAESDASRMNAVERNMLLMTMPPRATVMRAYPWDSTLPPKRKELQHCFLSVVAVAEALPAFPASSVASLANPARVARISFSIMLIVPHGEVYDGDSCSIFKFGLSVTYAYDVSTLEDDPHYGWGRLG